MKHGLRPKMAKPCENPGGGPELRVMDQPISAMQKLPFSHRLAHHEQE
jgi:hypothetical protein